MTQGTSMQGLADPTSFELAHRIRFSECDPAGIVFYPQYFVMFNDLLEAWVDQLLPGTGFAAERHTGLAAESMFAAIHDHPESLVTTPAIERLDDALVGKLLARNPHLTDDEFITAVTEIVGDRAVVSGAGTGGGVVEGDVGASAQLAVVPLTGRWRGWMRR